jgi:hypothetical protein
MHEHKVTEFEKQNFVDVLAKNKVSKVAFNKVGSRA